MAHTDPKPGGFAALERLLSSTMNLVRTGINNSLDGLNGGTYTLAAQLILNGTDMFKLGSRLMYTSRAVTRRFPMGPGASYNVGGTVGYTYDPGSLTFLTATTHGQQINTPLPPLPHGAVLDSVAVRFVGAAGAEPGNKPSIGLTRYSINAASTAMGTASDVWTSVGAYQTAHDITISGIAHTIDRTNTYVLRFTSESGANQTLGAQIIAMAITCTVSAQNEWD